MLKDDYFTVTQAAEYMQVTRQTISRWINYGLLPTEKIGREKLIAKEDLGKIRCHCCGKLYIGIRGCSDATP